MTPADSMADSEAEAAPRSRMSAEDLAYRARALGQAHPMTPLAKRFSDQAIAEQRKAQPMAEIGIWAGAAILGGYCLRRVEETDAGLDLQINTDVTEGTDGEGGLPMSVMDSTTGEIAESIRDDTADRYLLGEADRTIEALERIISSEVSRRLDNWKDQVDQSAWGELEEYLAWWVIRGYALRAAEMVSGAIA